MAITEAIQEIEMLSKHRRMNPDRSTRPKAEAMFLRMPSVWGYFTLKQELRLPSHSSNNSGHSFSFTSTA